MKQIQIHTFFHLPLTLILKKVVFFRVQLKFFINNFNFSQFYHETIIRTYYTFIL